MKAKNVHLVEAMTYFRGALELLDLLPANSLTTGEWSEAKYIRDKLFDLTNGVEVRVEDKTDES